MFYIRLHIQRANVCLRFIYEVDSKNITKVINDNRTMFFELEFVCEKFEIYTRYRNLYHARINYTQIYLIINFKYYILITKLKR